MARKKNSKAPRNRVKERLGNGSGGTDTLKMPAPVGAETEETEETEKPKRIPASEATYLAAQLHETRSQLVNMKQIILQKDQVLLQKDQAILQKDQVILNLEAKMIDAENTKLRVEHSLAFDETVHKDEETGEVYRLKAKKQGQ